MDKLITTIRLIVNQSTELKNRFTNEPDVPVEFGCIFCQSDEEYEIFTNAIKVLGKAVEDTKRGYTYLLDESIDTNSGPLRLVKIRKPDPNRPERGDADFNTNYNEFKKKYGDNSRFETVKRDTFEMLRLSDPGFNVIACFSNIPKSKDLGIKL